MTLDAARVEGEPVRVPAGSRVLVRLSGLLPLVAAACIVRLALLVGTLPAAVATPPGPEEGDVAAALTSASSGSGILTAPDPALVAFDPDLLETDADAVAPAAGPLAAPAATPSGAPAAATSPQDGVLSPKALLAVAAELKGRRELVERRERELETREAALALVEERIAAQIDRLEGFKQDLEGVLGRISADEEARLGQLAKVYESMKAKKAASILDAMGIDLLLAVVRRMRDGKVAAVIAEMDPAKARLLTAELAKAKMLPTLAAPAPSSPSAR